MVTRSLSNVTRRGSAGAVFFVTLGMMVACGVAYDFHLKQRQANEAARAHNTPATTSEWTLPSTAQWKPSPPPYSVASDTTPSSPISDDSTTKTIVPASHTNTKFERHRPEPRPLTDLPPRHIDRPQLTSTTQPTSTQTVSFKAPVDPHAKKGCNCGKKK